MPGVTRCTTPQGNPYTESIAEFIQKRLGVTPVPVFDYAEKKNVLIISYYLYQANQFDNFLAVFDRKGPPIVGAKNSRRIARNRSKYLSHHR
jgi:hypothetical protein